VQRRDLERELGCSTDELRCYFDDLEPDEPVPNVITPCNATWAMGFSWSSFVAQTEMVCVCFDAGLQPHQLLSLDAPHPADASEVATVSTDDVFFVHSHAENARDRLELFEQALRDHNVFKNQDKDENLADSTTALGCLLSNTPPWVEADLAKLFPLLLSIIGLCFGPKIAPLRFAGMFGVSQWFCQITRWLFSVFLSVNDFQKGALGCRWLGATFFSG